ncbi:leucyl/phenylalanyl-tRNA--protein transferase [Roseomonas sp. OT10]|uniref:leucyl/phenylalanyl-tRNA--protein transferase n=1 Tax=Roseomonas cutis TaxID=2897332 RepID=UPI001E480305|nr:leucyl/phenylalanyl-tRNA--protein transferase [Roseomonas sp. OT10]UFN50262.1 leucyl/phenylalanyl-tRNA--protein transferase [Roseomonas sp. OT10]
MSRRSVAITPDLVLRAYAAGLFPMAEGRRSTRLFWLDPERRGVMPLDRFHLSRSLARTLLSGRFTVTADRDFAAVVAGCAAPAPGRLDSWINPEVEALFNALHGMGHAHSIETWRDGQLVGGLYGVRLGAAFFGESMFSRETDASKVALAHLAVRLRRGGFALLDAQFLTDHLARFGAVEIPQAEYKAQLATALRLPARWETELPPGALEEEVRALRSAASGDG